MALNSDFNSIFFTDVMKFFWLTVDCESILMQKIAESTGFQQID